MKKYFTGFFMSWGMFTSIPCPLKIWDEEARGEMLACFPLSGLVIGILWALLVFFTRGVPTVLRAFLTAAVPWVLTGFMHLDGFMDVCDAVLSRRDLETRQKILKDSRVGAFAVISVILLIAGTVSVCVDIFQGAGGEFTELCKIIPFVLIPVSSRAMASIAVMRFRPMGTSQYSGKTYRKGLLILPSLCLLAAVLIPAQPCGVNYSPIVTAGVYLLCTLYAKHDLGGMNGDISGFALTIAETAGLLTLL